MHIVSFFITSWRLVGGIPLTRLRNKTEFDAEVPSFQQSTERSIVSHGTSLSLNNDDADADDDLLEEDSGPLLPVVSAQRFLAVKDVSDIAESMSLPLRREDAKSRNDFEGLEDRGRRWITYEITLILVVAAVLFYRMFRGKSIQMQFSA